MPCASFLSPAPHDRLEACGRRRRAGGGAPPRERRQQRPLRLPERGAALDGAVQRRPSHRRPPRGLPLPRARCHPRREPLGAERALCRRRAHTAAPSRTGAITPSPTKFSSGTGPVTLTDVAWPPKPPAQPLSRRNRSPEISLHGHPLGSPINRGPELELEPTPPLHSSKTTPSHWKSPREPSSPTPAASTRHGTQLDSLPCVHP